MTVLRPRSRSISIRLSQDEFLALRQLCVSTGARSISDIARKAMLDVLERMNRESLSDSPDSSYRDQIRSLEQRVEQLAAELASFRGRQSPSGSLD